MSIEEDENYEERAQNEEYDWRNYGDHDQSYSESLEAKDVLAIFIASLQTIFLPIVILCVAMLALGIAFGLIF